MSSPVSHYNPQLRRALMQRIHLSAPPPFPLQHQVRGTSGVWTCEISWSFHRFHMFLALSFDVKSFHQSFHLIFCQVSTARGLLASAADSMELMELAGGAASRRSCESTDTTWVANSVFFSNTAFLALPQSPFLKSRG